MDDYNFFLPIQEFPKNILHLSGCMLINSLFARYGLKDVSGILQPRFIPLEENEKSICGE